MPLNKTELISDLTEAFEIDNIGKDNISEVIIKMANAFEKYVKSGDVETLVINHTKGKGKII